MHCFSVKEGQWYKVDCRSDMVVIERVCEEQYEIYILPYTGADT